MTKRGALAWVAVALGALGVLALWGSEPPADELPQQEPPAPSQATDAAQPLTEALDASAPARPQGAVTFDEGFCSASGVESFEVRYSLERLLAAELRRRREGAGGGGGAEDSRVLRDAVDPATRPGVLDRARQAVARSPDSPFPQVAVALAADEAGAPDEQLAALRRARALLPDDPAVGLALAEATRNTADLDEAIAGLTSYLAADPSPPASRLRARLEVQRDIQRDYRREARDGITVLWPPGALTNRQADELAVAVDRGLDEAAAFTGTARRQRLTVIVYPSRSELLAVTCARSWSSGVYDGTLRVVAAPTAQGLDWRALRHETLHAQLSPFAPHAPRWFHEGVAQSFAQEPAPRGRWSLMVKNRVWVPFSSLDGTFQVFGADSDAALAYAQSLAMVELMRELGGSHAVATALDAFQSGADTPTALARACGRPEVTGADLLAFLERRLAQRP